MNFVTLVNDALAYSSAQDLAILSGGPSPENIEPEYYTGQLVPLLNEICHSVRVVDVVNASLDPESFKDTTFVLNLVYGYFGEDGTVRGFLDCLNLPSSGSPVLASAIGMNKEIFTSLLLAWNYRVPSGVMASDLLKKDHIPEYLKEKWIAKPVSGGSSIGIHVGQGDVQLNEMLNDLDAGLSNSTRIEEFIEGTIGTIAIIEVHGQTVIGDCIKIGLPEDSYFYDADVKEGKKGPIKPDLITGQISERISSDVAQLYGKLGCKGLVRVL